MIYINTYLRTVERIRDGCDMDVTPAELLGYLPSEDNFADIKEGKIYQGRLDSLPRIYRKAIEFKNGHPIYWINDPVPDS